MNPTLLSKRFSAAQSQLVIQTADLPLGTLAQMVDAGAIDLQPGFQRRERWDVERQSALIESFLLNVPVPPVYLAEEQTGTYTAIDGKQRLRAIADFIGGRLQLKSLERLHEAEGSRFDDLPNEIANALRLRPYIRVITLLKQTNPTLKFEVFLRLNKGGEQLNNQEIRNVAYRGPLNDLVYRLAESEFLRQQLKIKDGRSAAYREMVDAEYVLRFLTLAGQWQEFSGNLAQEMNIFMEKGKSATQASLADFADIFETSTTRCNELWGVYAFKRPEVDTWRDQTIAGMYDAEMLAVSELTERQFRISLEQGTDRILRNTKALFNDDLFDKSVRTGTNTPARIKYRVGKVKEILLR